MVSAKFHIDGEDGDWFRVRIQEEIYAHGLEGDVLRAADKILVVILEGHEHTIRRMHEDMIALCPKGIICSELIIANHKTDLRAKSSNGSEGIGQEHMLQLMMEMERRITRIDQKLSRLIAFYEAQEKPADFQIQTADKNKKQTDEQTASDGFSSMFGEG
jgi:hypothetical protein